MVARATTASTRRSSVTAAASPLTAHAAPRSAIAACDHHRRDLTTSRREGEFSPRASRKGDPQKVFPIVLPSAADFQKSRGRFFFSHLVLLFCRISAVIRQFLRGWRSGVFFPNDEITSGARDGGGERRSPRGAHQPSTRARCRGPTSQARTVLCVEEACSFFSACFCPAG